MRLPTYPIATIDPHFSIWSRQDKLTDDDTYLWCGIKKRIEGKITVDGETFRFLGKGKEEAIPQIDNIITPYTSTYIFENEKIQLKFTTWSPFILDDFHLLSVPCAYLDTAVKALDGQEHTVNICFTAYEELCQGKKKGHMTKYSDVIEGKRFVKMGLTKQKPLNDSGDTYAADWGYVCLWGEENGICKEGIKSVGAAKKCKEAEFSTIIAYDDVYSIDYFGDKLKGLWAEKFTSIDEAMKYCKDNHQEILQKVKAWEKKILDDSAEFGEAYQTILIAAARQVLAAHKLVRNKDGELLYMSKECHSNGCINTVDVSYPAMPMYLLYAPELVKAMLTGIFHFAESDLWNVDFAPHDIGRYPLACGQVYALKPHLHLKPHKYSYKTIYKEKSTNIYMPQFQMPVEECGNMLILTYAYYIMSGNKQFLRENLNCLTTWANYLKKKGVVLDNQLCTDDFAGHSKKNVNLAIKGVMGIACYDRICKELELESDYDKVAKAYAAELMQVAKTDKAYLPFNIGGTDTWSLKYNLVWDILFDFNLFPEEFYKAETEKYRDELNAYGVPLDYRRDFTKTDWMLWAACLDDSNKNTELFSGRIVAYLNDTKDRNCFSDWVETKEPKQSGFDHRTVQAGLWMPVLKKKLLSK